MDIKDRAILMTIREGLLMILRAIEAALGMETSRPSRRHADKDTQIPKA